MSAKKAVFEKLKDKMGMELSKPINIFEWKPEQKKELTFNPENELKKTLNEQLEQIGLSILWTKRTPFDGVTDKQYEREVVITGIGQENEKRKILIQKAQAVSNFADILNALKMFIVESEPVKEILMDKGVRTDYNIPLLPVIEKDELDEIKNKKELLSKLKKEKK